MITGIFCSKTHPIPCNFNLSFKVFFLSKDVVFKLWYKYLQVTEIAFTGSPQGTVPTKGSIFYQRDANLLNRNQRNKSGRKRKLDPSCESDDDDELELCSHFSDEEFYEGSNRLFYCVVL